MSADRNVGPSISAGATGRVASRSGIAPAARSLGGLLGQSALGSPFTSSYVLLLLVTTVTLRHLPPSTAASLLAASSTDVHHLARDPVSVLVASALWLPGRHWWPYAVVFMIVLAPLERRFGAGRAVSVFLSGHVLATLLTELPVAAAITVHVMAPSAAHRIDVGVSYGMFAAIAASAGALPKRQRILVLAAVGAWLLWRILPAPDMTGYGHLLSLLIGAGWWPVLYRHRPSAAWPVRTADGRCEAANAR